MPEAFFRGGRGLFLFLFVAEVSGGEEADDGDEDVDEAFDALDGEHGDGLEGHEEADGGEEAAVEEARAHGVHHQFDHHHQEDHQAADGAVQPVDDAQKDGTWLGVLLLDIRLDGFRQRGVSRLVALHNFAALLSDDDDVVILVNYLHNTCSTNLVC